MQALSAKSANGRINWILDKGRLTEISPESYKFTLTANDTKILFGLLAAGSEDIIRYAQAELRHVEIDLPDEYLEDSFADGVEG